MLVTFISQCAKKSLLRTRRILDAFANRIGDNVWQTAITEEGLITVKKLLRQSATKSTAVACHRVRTRQRTELVWVVGNRNKFNEVGVVAVNGTEQDIKVFQDKHNWKTLELIKYASAIAGLFHDFGKANQSFQEKINPNKKINPDYLEPYRHEWVSLRLFEALVRVSSEDKCKTDEEWLNELANNSTEPEILLKNLAKDGIDQNIKKNPLNGLPAFAQLVAWLIVSHHKLPHYPSWMKECTNSPLFADIEKTNSWFNCFNAEWNSHKSCIKDTAHEELKKNWSFTENALPFFSTQWSAKACLLASEAKNKILPILKSLKSDGNFLHDDIYTTHISRLVLMLADHHFSSLDITETENLGWRNENYKIYTNTCKNKSGQKSYKQQLDEHLIGVAENAKKISTKLPYLKKDLQGLEVNQHLEENVSKDKIKFVWQNNAKNLASEMAEKTINHGFFGVNMASTGSGKTLANAKIMYMLGKKTGKIRFNVALGLRTLTLQTGKAFKEMLDLSDDDLSIAVGGISLKALFEKNQEKYNGQQNQQNQNLKIDTKIIPETLGSESAQDYLNPELYIDYQGKLTEHPLYEWTKPKERADKLLQPPILVCTIDHLIPATEGIKGGQQIAPMLRLMTSDLILDEPDDFGLDDLPALCRLIHWAGMLGSKVLLSTATMPPAFVYACFEAYQAGWSAFAQANIDDWNGNIQCAWFDETQKPTELLANNFKSFKDKHGNFVDKRIAELKKMPAKRLGKIIEIEKNHQGDRAIYKNMADTIFSGITQLHDEHKISKNISGNNKNISIGLIRMANINPMITVSKELLKKNAPNNTEIHYCIYHSRFPLAVRSYIEEKLDFLLNRKNPNQIWSEENGVGEILKNSHAENHIFVVIASPVAEVGRDHDYDWAIVEPSSMRSIVQIAGRVLRHREVIPQNENIYLLNQNIKALKGAEICFNKPGFESTLCSISSHVLKMVLKTCDYESVTALPKIKHPEDLKFNSPISDYLVHQEHKALRFKLLGNNTPETNNYAKLWWGKKIAWAGELQLRQPFRNSDRENTCYSWIESEYDEMCFKLLNLKTNQLSNPRLEGVVIETDNIKLGLNSSFWFDLSPNIIYQKLIEDFLNQGKKFTLSEISRLFGDFTLKKYNNDISTFMYSNHLGLYAKIGD